MGGPGHVHVVRADLDQAATLLETAAAALTAVAPDLRRRPDAGASSGEVATALAALADAVDGLATEVGAMVESTRTSALDFATTDTGVSTAMQQRRAGLRP